MGVLFGSNCFSSSFLQEALDEDVHHVGALPTLRDVQVTIGIFFSGVLLKHLLISSILSFIVQVFKVN
jgi:hypothetical protein